MKKVFLWVVLAVFSGAGQAVIFKDGQVHTIDYRVEGDLGLEDSYSGQATTANIISGGIITGAVSLDGGSLVNVYGGDLQGGVVISRAGPELNLYSGTIRSASTYINNQLGSRNFSILTAGNINIYGGTINHDVIATNSAIVQVYGGNFVYGAFDTAITGGHIIIYGYNFKVNGQSIQYGVIPAAGVLTGTLQNGDSLDCRLTSGGGVIELRPTPEPSTLFLTGLGALCMRRRSYNRRYKNGPEKL